MVKNSAKTARPLVILFLIARISEYHYISNIQSAHFSGHIALQEFFEKFKKENALGIQKLFLAFSEVTKDFETPPPRPSK